MAGRPTIADVASEAQVSVATVDRVLNGRHRVREETARRVYDAAERIGYHATSLIRQRLQQNLPQYRLGFVLQRPRQFFYQDFARTIEQVVTSKPGVRGMPTIEFMPSQSPEDIVATLRRVASNTQAVAMAGPDHPAVSEAVLELKQAGIPVFSLLSDFASGIREGYVGLDNRKVGRTAAWIISRAALRPGKVGVFVGSSRFHGHELREIGLRAYLRDHSPEFQVLDTQINLETRQITHEATVDLIRRHPDLVALYVAGGGMEGAISALREEGMARKLVAVCNEITPESRAGLADEIITMVIATPLAKLCETLVDLMIRTIEIGSAETPGQTFLPFDIYLSENI
ncbi:MAG: LacI family DNA-binding transcriptional regulator [Cucumibacter sp.]